jgi:hypothetical protein
VTTWHEKAVHVGDAAEKTTALWWRAVVGLAIIAVPALVGWSTAQTAGVFVEHMNPTGAVTIQTSAGVVAAGVVGLVFLGIDRFTRRTPVVKR